MPELAINRRISMTGFAQHGKNTVADVLCSQYGWQQHAYADKLRELAAALNPLLRADPQKPNRYNGLVQQYGYEGAKQLPEVRRFLQDLGTQVREVLGEDTWVQALERELWKLYGPDAPQWRQELPGIVVTDVRFQNEVDAALDHGLLWGVVREVPGSPGTLYDNGVGTDHPSEAYIPQALERADHVFYADSLDDLRAQVFRAMQAVRL